MPKFIVYRQEVYVQPVRIEAQSAQEARELVADGKGECIESGLYYSFDLDPDLWTVEQSALR